MSAHLHICPIRAIKTNQDLHPSTSWTALFFNDFWGTPLTHSGSHKSYRPLCVLSFRLNYLIHGLNPAGYHLVNVLLHTIVSVLFTKFASHLFNGRKRAAVISGLLFATHPIHSEAVAGIVGRADCGAALFFLLSLMSYIKFCRKREKQPPDSASTHLYLSLLFAALSMLTKEYGVTVLAVSGVYHFCIHSKVLPLTMETIQAILTEKRFAALREGIIHLVGSAIILIGFRLYMMGLKAPDFAPADNPAADSNCLLTRILTFLYLPAFNFWLLVYPFSLSFDWSMESIPLVQSIGDPRNIFTLIFYTCTLITLKSIFDYQQYSSDLSGIGSALASFSSSSGGSSSCYCSPCSHQHHHQHLKPVKRSLNPKATNNNSMCNCPVDEDGISNATANGLMPVNGGSLLSLAANGNLNCSTEEMPRQHVSRMDCLTMAMALAILPFIPATNLFFYVGFVVAERVLYIPSFGYCLLVAIGIDTLMKRKTSRFITVIALSILLMSFSLRTFVRNIDWSTEENLYRSGVTINPPKAFGNLANILSANGKKREAEVAYRKALSYRSNMADVHYNLVGEKVFEKRSRKINEHARNEFKSFRTGILLQEQARYEEALAEYKAAVQYRPRLAMAHLNMGLVLGQLGKKAEAIEVYKHCASLDGTGLKDPKTHESTKISALFNLGRLYADDGQYKEAIEVYQEAIDKMPSHYQPQSLYNMMGEAHFKLGQFKQAEHWYKEALKVKKDHIPAHLTYAKLLAKLHRLQEAEHWFLKAKELDPNDSSVYQHYGQFLSECERHEEAADIYVRGAQLAPNDYEMVFNAANALRQALRNTEAEKFYKEAVILRPNEVTSHMNLGAMLHVNGKLLEAESSYLEALRLKPDDTITQNNLAKLRHLLNQKRAAGR
ncbi:transmembrane and TPR repeat-containing protein 2-like protein [Dinothrombium tinctorium]|uniref:dolichyl-phosphate-mannose--protein mannosyltransferase n=1 Tax=Dinothrombium tinctorium TaxID=1965070 RepID=A0A3S3SRB0_9ACAR|nr:transmembrane and TPR repeat-containing protein 2-like protein [Dinothrombium tinctorium]